MGKPIISITLSTLIFSILSCDINLSDSNNNDNNTIEIVGSGDVISRTIDLPAFHSITNTGTFQIRITKGTPQNVVLRMQENIFDVLTHEVEDGVLNLGFENNVNVRTSEAIEAEITIPKIRRTMLLGVGDFVLNGSKQGNLRIDIIGVGDIKAYGLEVDTCHVTITGVGDSKIRVNNLLNVTITGVGNIFYKGNPAITSSITGNGSVINDNQ